jgi:hypothetical protein
VTHCLDALSGTLEARGAPRTADDGEPPPSDGWSELNREYEQRFGIPAEKATPPPTAEVESYRRRVDPESVA